MTVDEVVKELKTMGSEGTKRTWMRHGAREPVFGVKVGDMKKIQKRVKKDYALALGLFETGIADAMYLAGLIADDAKMTKKDLNRWVKQANWGMVCDYSVAGTAAESRFGWELGQEWIESKKESIASAGWSTLSMVVAIKEDAELDLAAIKKLVERVGKTIHKQPNKVRYTMNGFLISVGAYCKSLTKLAIETGKKIGRVEVDMGDTACQVPDAPEYIRKIEKRGSIGKKRASAKC